MLDRNNQPRSPSGSDNQARRIILMHEQLAPVRRPMPIPVKPVAGGGGWDWMYPTHKELDPTLLYTKGKLAFLSPMNPLVVTGLTDIILGSNVKAGAGTWLCVKNVPAAVTGSYNVPQIPYPGATGTPAGTPLKGDIDGSNVFWVLVTPIC